MSDTVNYKDSLSLPKTEFAMRANLAEREPACLSRWEKNNLWGEIKKARSGCTPYVLHDGPPYANGSAHHGHLLNKVLKDIIVKDRTMAGYNVSYVPGWDCHGLPIESQVDRELGHKKREMDPAAFHAACRVYAERQIEGQKKSFERLGIFARWDDPYKTMAPAYEADIVRELARLVDTGLVYKGLRPVHWCTSHQTALAEAEVEYESKTSSSAYVAMRVDAGQEPFKGLDPVELVVWTTTPWSLPGNVGVMVHPDIDYAVLNHAGKNILVAKDRVDFFFADCFGTDVRPSGEPLRIVCGKDLIGVTYQHPFLPRTGRVVADILVSIDTGTGAVHTAPAHGADDFAVAQRTGLPIICPVDAAGVLTDDAGLFSGQTIGAATSNILAYLAETGSLLSPADKTLSHRYAHCWRCHKPVITRATEQWFLALDEAKDGSQTLRGNALASLKEVTWVPGWGVDRIGGMLAARPDWCLSRQRLWGVPLPIFYCTKCSEPKVESALMRKVAAHIAIEGAGIWWTREVSSLVGEIVCTACGHDQFRKETDILDVWFDSGVSYAAVLEARGEGHVHGPPADLYLEGSDQHRGWFHSALLTSVATRKQAPYRTVLTHGFVLDGKGRKISKSLGNFEDPFAKIAKEGAEVWRLWTASEDYQQDVRISQEIMRRLGDSYRRVRNTVRFLLGNLHGFDFGKDSVPTKSLLELDRWAIGAADQACSRLRDGYKNFKFHGAMQQLTELCGQDLSAFYLDILKDRLYAAAPKSVARRSAQTALYIIAHDLVRVMAPVFCFTAEEAWQVLPGAANVAPSVHLAHYLGHVDAGQHDLMLAAYQSEVRVNFAELQERIATIKEIRRITNLALEEARRAKIIGSSTEAQVTLASDHATLASLGFYDEATWSDMLIVAKVVFSSTSAGPVSATIERAPGSKCARCWLVRTEVGTYATHHQACGRCVAALKEIAA